MPTSIKISSYTADLPNDKKLRAHQGQLQYRVSCNTGLEGLY